MGRFVCFEGGDAVGKTTAARGFAERLRARGERVVWLEKKSTDAPDPYLRERLELMRELTWDYPKAAPTASWGDHHWYLQVMSYFSLVDRCRLRPALDTADWVVVDNWYFKIQARFLLKDDFPEALVFGAVDHLTVPDLLVQLDLDPTEALRRRPGFTPTEAGAHDGMRGTAEDFVTYQSTVRDQYRRMAEGRPWWRVLDVTGLAPDDVVQGAQAIARAHLGARTNGHRGR